MVIITLSLLLFMLLPTPLSKSCSLPFPGLFFDTGLFFDNGSLAQMAELIHSWINEIRFEISDELRSRVPHMIGQALLPALIVGIRDYLHVEHWSVFSATGTSHLVAISGLHVGMVWAICYFILSRWARSKTDVWPQVIATLIGFLYSLLAGFSLPTQRAILMLGVISLLSIARRVIRPYDAWLIALLVTCLTQPAVVKSLSFWLSFTAVALLIALSLHAKTHSNVFFQKSWLWIRAQLVLTFGLAPIIAGHFGVVSWISPVVNMLAVPVVTLVIIPGVLLVLVIEWCVVKPMQFFNRGISDTDIQFIVEMVSELLTYLVDIMLILLSSLIDVAWHNMSGIVNRYPVTIPVFDMTLRYQMMSFCLSCWVVTLLLILPLRTPGSGILMLGCVPLIFTLIGLNFNN